MNESLLDDIKLQLTQGEHISQDFKLTISDTKKIARTLAAFANTVGGKLWIGVKDNGKIKGCKAQEELYMIEMAADRYCQKPIEFSANIYDLPKDQLLEIIVEPSAEVHRAPDDKMEYRAYARQDDNTVWVSSAVYKSWVYKKNYKKKGKWTFSNHEQLLFLFLRENDGISLNQFARMCDLPRRKAEDIIVKLLVWKVLTWKNEDDKVLYCLGIDPNLDDED